MRKLPLLHIRTENSNNVATVGHEFLKQYKRLAAKRTYREASAI
jgi:hypothetical protein